MVAAELGVVGAVGLKVGTGLLVAGHLVVRRNAGEPGRLLQAERNVEQADVRGRGEPIERLDGDVRIVLVGHVVAAADAEEQLLRRDPVHVARHRIIREGRGLAVVGVGPVRAVERRQQPLGPRPAVVERHPRADGVGQLAGDVAGRILRLLGPRNVERARLRIRRRRRIDIAGRLGQRRLVGAEEPHPVLDNRPAEREAGLVTVFLVLRIGHVLRFGRVGEADAKARHPGADRRKARRRRGAARQLVPLILQPDVAVPVVRAALGDDVDHATRRAAELRRVAARLDLDLFDEVGNDVLARRAALQVGGLDAVDDVAVFAGAGAVDRQAAELVLAVGAGRLGHEAREVAPLRQQCNLLTRDVRLPRALLDVHERRFGRDLDAFRNALQPQREIHLLDLSEADLDAALLLRRKALQRSRDLVHSRRHRRETIDAFRIGRGGQYDTGVRPGFNRDPRKHRAGTVPHHAFDGAALFLGDRRPGKQQSYHQCGKCTCSHFWFILLITTRHVSACEAPESRTTRMTGNWDGPSKQGL